MAIESEERDAPRPRPRSCLVVGGGPSGLVTLRNLSQADRQTGAPPFERVELVERRAEVGGVWYFDERTAYEELQAPAHLSQHSSPFLLHPGAQPRWPSPAYSQLRGNVLPRFLSFSDSDSAPFPPPSDNEPFPTLAETHDYLVSFAKPLRKAIRCDTEVKEVCEREDGTWDVVLREWAHGKGGRETVERWDAVVIATAWYDTPYYPSAPGLEAARAAGHIRHAKWYRSAQIYANKRVVVLGNGNSANDMAAHLAALRKPSSEPILRSIRRAALDMFPSLPDPGIKDVAPVRQYHVRARARARGSASGSVGGIEAQESDTVVDLELEDGTIVRDVDYVLLGTGYGFSLPWISLLRRAPPSSQPPTSDTPGLHNASGSYTPLTPPIPVPRIPNLYRHTLHAHNPSLGFVGLAVSSSPFITSDLCSRWIRNVWNGGIAIPNSSEERAEDEKSRLELLERRAKESKVQAQPHKNGAPADGSTKSPAGASAFHILGTDEPSFAQLLRVEIVDAEPHLEDVLERWDEAQEEERLGMYKRKLRSLYEARERAERADRGEGKEITWNQNKSAGQSAHL